MSVKNCVHTGTLRVPRGLNLHEQGLRCAVRVHSQIQQLKIHSSCVMRF
jgi:hypothetical protein